LTGVRSALSRAGFRPRVPRMNRLDPGCGLVQLRVLRRCLRLARFSWLCVRGVHGAGARLFELRALLGPARQGFRAWNRAGLRAVRMGRALLRLTAPAPSLSFPSERRSVPARRSFARRDLGRTPELLRGSVATKFYFRRRMCSALFGGASRSKPIPSSSSSSKQPHSCSLPLCPFVLEARSVNSLPRSRGCSVSS